jgi:hypothetical protein
LGLGYEDAYRVNLHEKYHKIPKEDRPRPKLEECVKGRLYQIACRNLRFGVYDGDGGFIGIREKFGSKFLFTELHWDKCTSFGTVHTAIDTGINLPKEIGTCERDNQPLFNWLIEQEF